MYDDIAAFALELAKECGAILAEAFHKRDHDVVTKLCEVDLVTKTDKLIEKTIIDRVNAKYPNHRIIGEESTSEGAPVELTDEIT